MAQKIDFDINKLPWEAIARVMTPILAPIVLAAAWVFLARTNRTVDWLSNVFALAELVPAIDLNLPPGVVLGSFYNSAKEIEEAVKTVIKTVKDLPLEEVLVPEIIKETEIQKRKPGESWIDYLERRLRETGLFA